MDARIEQLQQELHSALKNASKHRSIIRVARTLCFGGTLIYFGGMIIVMLTYLITGSDGSIFYSLSPNPSIWEQYKFLIVIIPLFALIIIGSYGINIFQGKFTEIEQKTIRSIIQKMFPSAKLSLSPGIVSSSLIVKSNLFSIFSEQDIMAYSFGNLTFQDTENKVIFRDILIDNSRSMSAYVAKSIFKGLFSKRIENIAGGFRGIFAEADLQKKINGCVIIIPDHLENHLGDFSKSIQQFKKMNGNQLVKLEDIEFERYFTIYSSDEILARYILTPAMMLRITNLRRKYNRDIMLSFSDSKFFFAVNMPEGFLTLGNSSIKPEKALSGLYDNFRAVRETLDDLKIRQNT